jgi:signal transduction histidine kinase
LAESWDESFRQSLEREKLAALAEFAAAAGHEINNPLAVICGRAELLLRQEQNPERRRDLATIYGQAMRIHDLIADLMLFARPPQPHLEPLDVSALLEHLVCELRPRFDERNVELCREGPSEALVVYGDAAQLLVALRAIFDNALEAAPEGSRVVASCQRIAQREAPGIRGQRPAARKQKKTRSRVVATAEPSAQAVQIVVQDEGPGIPGDVRPHIFDPFYSGRSAGRGLGLGLSKSWRIVTAHGGHIDVEDPPEGGAKFAVTLPQGTCT